MIAAALLGLVATFKRRRRESFAAHWTALSAIFVYLSMDELIGFHELVGGRIHDETPTHGLFYCAATIFTLPMVLLVGFSFLRFVGHLPRATRMLFVGAAALYVAGARGLEMVGGMVDERYGTEGLLYVALSTLEEACEMSGVVLFVYALLHYLGTTLHQPRLQISRPPG